MSKALAGALSSSILPQKTLRESIFEVFTSFVHFEYEILFQRKNLDKLAAKASGEDLYIEKMTRANIMDSDSLK